MSASATSPSGNAPRVLVVFTSEHLAALGLAMDVCDALEELGAHAELSSVGEEPEASSFDAMILVVAHPPRSAMRALGAFVHANQAMLVGTPLAVVGVCTHRRAADAPHAQAHRRAFRKQLRRNITGLNACDAVLFPGGARCSRCRAATVDSTRLRDWLETLGFHLLPAEATDPFTRAPWLREVDPAASRG